MRRKKTKKRLSTRLLALALSLTMVAGSFASNRLMVRANEYGSEESTGEATTGETPADVTPAADEGAGDTGAGEAPVDPSAGETPATSETPATGTTQPPATGETTVDPEAGSTQTSDPATGTTETTETPEQAEPVVITFTATKGGTVTSERQDLPTAADLPMSVTAIAADGYVFVNWTLSDGTSVTDFATFTPERANADYIANFKPMEEQAEEGAVVITFTATEGGTVSVDKQELLTEEDEIQEVTATADEGYIFKNWTKDGAIVSEDATFTPERESADYVANFEAEEETKVVMTFTATEGGTVSLEKQELGKDDRIMPVTAVADEGYVLVNWTLNDEEITTEETFTPEIPENIDEIEEIEYVANFAPAAFEYEETINGVTIFLAAKEGVFPAGTTVTVEPMTLEEVKEAVEEKLNENVDEANGEPKKEVVAAVMFDINFFDEENNNIQPNGIVRVRFTGIQMDIPDDIPEEDLEAAVIQYDNSTANETVEIINEAIAVDETEIELETEHFTGYGAVTYANQQPSKPTGNYTVYAGSKYPGSEMVPLYAIDGIHRVAYCFNMSRAYPSYGLFYTQEEYYYSYNNKLYWSESRHDSTWSYDASKKRQEGTTY